MPLKVINYKKVEMTNDEYAEYQRICRSYDRQNFKGEDLFKDLFETNEDGMIVYIKSLSNRQFSFEVIFFVMNLMQNQWLRKAADTVNEFIKEGNQKINAKIAELDKKIEEIDNKMPK